MSQISIENLWHYRFSISIHLFPFCSPCIFIFVVMRQQCLMYVDDFQPAVGRSFEFNYTTVKCIWLFGKMNICGLCYCCAAHAVILRILLVIRVVGHYKYIKASMPNLTFCTHHRDSCLSAINVIRLWVSLACTVRVWVWVFQLTRPMNWRLHNSHWYGLAYDWTIFFW